jgi:hypothetical protein
LFHAPLTRNCSEPAAWLPETPNAEMICSFDSPSSFPAAAAAP